MYLPPDIPWPLLPPFTAEEWIISIIILALVIAIVIYSRLKARPWQLIIREEFTESEIEDLLVDHPDLVEEGLRFEGRQLQLGDLRPDLLFRDRVGNPLIVEVKKESISRSDIGQIMEYRGLVPSESRVRFMIIGREIPPPFRRSLPRAGIEFKELSQLNYDRFEEPTQDIVRMERQTHGPVILRRTTLYDRVKNFIKKLLGVRD